MAQAQPKKVYPNLQGKVHKDAEDAIRNAYTMLFDLQDGILAMQQQLIGGAVGTSTIVANAVTAVTMQSNGYYIAVPKVTFTGGSGTGAAGTAILSGNRVTGVKITVGGTGYATPPTVVFTA